MDENDRQRRRLMRQRGAGTRDLGDVSFGFDFAGTPVVSSARKQTPSTKSSTRRNPRTRATSTGSQTSDIQVYADDVTPIIPSSKKRKRVAEIQEVEDDLGSEEPLFMSLKSNRLISPASSAVENHEPSTVNSKKQTPSSRSNLRTPLVQLNSNNSSSVKPGARSNASKSSRRTKSPMNIIFEDDLNEEDELSLNTSMNMDLLPQNESTVLEDQTTSTSMPRQSESNTFLPDNEGTRGLTATIPVNQQGSSLDSLENSSVEPTTRPVPAAPTHKRVPIPPKSRSRNRAKSSRKSKLKRHSDSAKSGHAVPITVYRRSRKSTADTDPLGAAPIPTVNAADVLSQITQEIGQSHISRLQTRHSAKEFERAWRYPILAFLANVEDMVNDVSRAQNDVYAMQARMRALKREASDVRSEVMRVRREREEIACDTERVRAERAARVAAEREDQELLVDLQDLDVAVQRGRARTLGASEDQLVFDEGDVLLLDVQMLLANGGLLAQAVLWNELLEKASATLPATLAE